MKVTAPDQPLLSLSPNEIRSPRCLLEDLGVAITVVPQRCLYLTRTGIEGYHLQRNKEDLNKERALVKQSLSDWIMTSPDEIAVVDLGAGDGRRVYPILETLIAVGKHIEYWAVDASGPMLTRNRPTVEPVVDIYRGEQTTWEAFSSNHSFRPNKSAIWLMLGNTYQGFEPSQMLPFLASLIVSPDDLLYVGCDTWNDRREKRALISRDLMKYSNEEMRCGFLKLLGIELGNVRHNVMWNEARNQFEMYACLVGGQEQSQKVNSADVLLMGVGRRMERKLFGVELSHLFHSRILHDERVDPFLTIGVCSKR